MTTTTRPRKPRARDTILSGAWYFAVLEQCHTLAVEMVRMDALADDYEARGQQLEADRVRWERLGIVVERSNLLRHLWANQPRAVQLPHA